MPVTQPSRRVTLTSQTDSTFPAPPPPRGTCPPWCISPTSSCVLLLPGQQEPVVMDRSALGSAATPLPPGTSPAPLHQ